MIKIEEVEVYGWKAALRGMRNPKDSWHLADSKFNGNSVVIGPNDLRLAKALHNGGPVHSKYKRFIHISMDITAPLYWWKEFDTYKVGTNCNSCSTMHRIEFNEFTRDMFSCEHMNEDSLKVLDDTIVLLNKYRDEFNRVKKDKTQKEYAKHIWWQMIQALPTSFNQKRTIEITYENATNMYTWRYTHKQDEWVKFCEMLMTLPYAKDIILPPHLQKEN